LGGGDTRSTKNVGIDPDSPSPEAYDVGLTPSFDPDCSIDIVSG
jgi:hypothetical protein